MKRKGLICGFLVLGLLLLLDLSTGAAAALPSEGTVNVVIEFTEDVNFAGLFPNADIYREFDIIRGVAATVPESLYERLTSFSFVKNVEMDQTMGLLEDTLDWGVDKINAEVVWGGYEDAKNVASGNYAGQGVKVAVIDTGIDYTHSDLNDNYQGGYDFVNGDSDPMDDHGHGTHCAGIIAAEDNGAGVIGVAPQAQLYGVKVLNSAGSGTYSDIISGIDWARNNGMDVISMSLGGSSGTSALESALINANNAGIVIAAASGNDYSGSISYPARYASTIAVGATDSSDTRASFSNYGNELDVTAPGVNIYSTVAGGGYQTMSGTSMATPMVSGVVALMLSKDPTLTPAEVRSILHSTSLDLGSTGFDIYYGYGRVQADEAVAAVGGVPDTTPPTVSITNPVNGATVGGTVSVTASASDNIGVSKVEFYIDSSLVATDTSSPYSYSWGTTAYSDASHAIKAIAYDAANNFAEDQVTVTVDNTVPPPADNELTSGVTVYSSLSGTGDTEMWFIQVEAGATNMRTVLNCPSGTDFDVYGRLGAEPTTSVYDFRGYTTSGEDVSFSNPGTGTWYIMVRSYSGSGNYDLTVTVTYQQPPPVDNELTSGVTVYSSLSGTGDTEMWFIQVPAGATNIRVVLDASGYWWTTDYDVYGRLGAEPTTSVYDFRGYTWGDEDVSFSNPGAGTWYIMARSYTGSGDYALTVYVS
ncbi:MAG: S8 family serine peptidase [Candidatus Odinarchaeota archaeon]